MTGNLELKNREKEGREWTQVQEQNCLLVRSLLLSPKLEKLKVRITMCHLITRIPKPNNWVSIPSRKHLILSQTLWKMDGNGGGRMGVKTTTRGVWERIKVRRSSPSIPGLCTCYMRNMARRS